MQKENSAVQPAEQAASEKMFTQAELYSEIEKAVRKRFRDKPRTELVNEATAETIDAVHSNAVLESEISCLREMLAQSHIITALTTAGVSAHKVSRASRLIDTKTVIMADGGVDSEALDREISTLIHDFPELSAKEAPKSGFCIGSGTDGKAVKPDPFRRIFGNE